jgi:hypothetical protein
MSAAADEYDIYATHQPPEFLRRLVRFEIHPFLLQHRQAALEAWGRYLIHRRAQQARQAEERAEQGRPRREFYRRLIDRPLGPLPRSAGAWAEGLTGDGPAPMADPLPVSLGRDQTPDERLVALLLAHDATWEVASERLGPGDSTPEEASLAFAALASRAWSLTEAQVDDLRKVLVELRASYSSRRALDVAGPDGDGRSSGTGEEAAREPFVPLMSWSEIFAALNEPHRKTVWENNEQIRAKIRKLNQDFDGPIIMPKVQGGQPQVAKHALIAWWARLEEDFINRAGERAQEATSTRATVSGTHEYGRTGTVVPDIDGHVKKTRKTA